MLNDMSGKINTAIIVAAGSGSRLASDTPKQFLKLKDVEILAYSVQAFLEHPQIDAVIVVTSADYLDHVIRHYPDCKVVPGGDTRQDSVFNGLEACSASTDNVLIHDAARPLIPSWVIDSCLSSLETCDGVAPAITPADSMVQIEDSGFRNLNRDSLRIVQTPQCFHLNILKAAHASGKVDTDEMGLVKQSNPQALLGFIEGAPETMKVTRPLDLEIIKNYLDAAEK
ncbi:MAG: 2-C-methyl-D-erythritol 4-phosphate cytidylyltransferase [Candidatus Marinimicrobia bacterium]|nr:2-C-methyl-D-erythritol 4-phosphate cytidylyltransferase [Candidatus Neomarinimicrobiota bacterium]